jgi:hypothetical protein
MARECALSTDIRRVPSLMRFTEFQFAALDSVRPLVATVCSSLMSLLFSPIWPVEDPRIRDISSRRRMGTRIQGRATALRMGSIKNSNWT